MPEFTGNSIRFLLFPFRMVLIFFLFITRVLDFLATCVGWFLVSLICAGICFCSMWLVFSLALLIFTS